MAIETQFLKNLYTQRQAKTYSQVSGLFELNYQKILTLIPNIPTINKDMVIRHSDEKDLFLFIKDKSPYTATFVLTHQLENATGIINRPDIQFKVYFDANLLEVISVCNKTTLNQSHPYLAQCSDMNIQWELNTFIEKWLDYCLDRYQGETWQTL